MKKIFIIASFLIVAFGCANADKTEKKTETVNIAEDTEAKKGLDLIAKSDCLTCHKVMDNFNGPAYAAVAAKYPNNEASIKYLAEKIQKGGSGVWGSLPMLAHPDISEADARAMVKYILSIK